MVSSSRNQICKYCERKGDLLEGSPAVPGRDSEKGEAIGDRRAFLQHEVLSVTWVLHKAASCAACLGHSCAYVLLVKARGTVVGRVEETASTRFYSFPGTLGVLTQTVWLSFYLANSQITLPLLALNASLSTPCLYLWTQTSQR